MQNVNNVVLLACSAPPPRIRSKEKTEKDKRKPTVGRRDSKEIWLEKGLLGPLLFGKTILSRGIGFVTVAPLTNIAPLDLEYQYYLNAIFHTRLGSIVPHRTCIPLITFMMLAFFAQFEGLPLFSALSTFTTSTSSSSSSSSSPSLGINGADLFAFMASFWYPILGCYLRIHLFGFLIPCLMLGLSHLAKAYHQHFRWNDVDSMTIVDEGHWWFSPTPLLANPLLWILILGTIQAASHLAEPTVPPRMNETDVWLAREEYFASLWNKGPLRAVFTFLFCWASGIVDEVWASPRLLPVLVLQCFHWLGFYPQQAAYLERLVKWSTKYGNPAIDYIGRGGTSDPLVEGEDAEWQKYLELKMRLNTMARRKAFAIDKVDTERIEWDEDYRVMVEYKEARVKHVHRKWRGRFRTRLLR